MHATVMRRVLVAGIVMAVLGPGVSRGAPLYEITPIAPLPPMETSASTGIAPNAGYVAGFQIQEQTGWNIVRGFRWQQPGPLVELPPLGTDPWSHARAVDDNGDVVGYSGNYDASVGTACLWDGTAVTELPNLPGTSQSRADDINNSGRIVGTSHIDFPTVDVACIWEGGTVSIVGTGQTESSRTLTAAYGVNEDGQVVGETDDPLSAAQTHAFFWDGDPSHDALDLPELPDTMTSMASAVNDLGQAVGAGLLWTVHSPALFWDTDHSVHEISPPPGADSPIARDINNAGWVVGTSGGGAWVWHKDEGSVLLQDLLVGPEAALWDLGPPTGGAMGIDNYGRIAGQGLYNGQHTAFLLTPVPEPSTLVLAIGLFGLLATRLRRRRK